ncbi:hypothetical protein Lfu02_04230 [Longispora fulva]|uniref:Uncharacterized protein n=1 Tax=Longispora fulva TaxID=619741 RepID=A0A8J7GCW3_9ACTN|nr:hypothetical protein [Longispora fulva]MBG6135710.1 hypothetical protein [Longispora fulva]GIG56051.1 hypothetical protein Lfu02_04230 [Longispora fulva]
MVIKVAPAVFGIGFLVLWGIGGVRMLILARKSAATPEGERGDLFPWWSSSHFYAKHPSFTKVTGIFLIVGGLVIGSLCLVSAVAR